MLLANGIKLSKGIGLFIIQWFEIPSTGYDPRRVGLFIIQWSDLTCHDPRIFFLSFFLPFPLRYLLYLRNELNYPRRIGFPFIYHATIWFDVSRSKNFFSFFLFTLPSSLSTLFANWIKLSKKGRFIYHPKSLRRVTIQARNVFFFLSTTVSLVIHAYEYSLQRKWAIILDEETIAKRYSSARYNNGNYNYSYSLGKLGKRSRQLSFERGWTFCPQNLFTNDKILFFFERWTDRYLFRLQILSATGKRE